MRGQGPVITAGAIVALVEAGIIMAVALGWLDLSDSQLAAVMTFVAAAAAIVAPLVGAAYVHRRVTPLDNPTDVDGAPLTRDDNSPAIRARNAGW